MDTGHIITVVGLLAGLTAELLILVGVIALAWGKAKGTLDSLRDSIVGLTKSVDKLDDKLDEHSERIAKLEGVSV
jgi:hypothetical protein